MLTNKTIEQLKKIVTSENILLEEEERYVYATDATNSQNIKSLPDVVIFVETIEQIQAIMRLANKEEIPVIPRGAGTNMVGGCTTDCGGIVLNFSKMNKILEINQDNLTARVQPGVVLQDLSDKVSEYGLFYPPDPSNLKVSTIGGSVVLNSSGPKSFKYGATKDYVLDLKVVLADGTLIRTGSNTSKNSTGYQMSQLFIGSEGTLGIVVEVLLKLIPKPEGSKVLLAYFETISEATNAVTRLIENKIQPATLDLMDKKTLETVEEFCPSGLLTQYEAALVLEVDGYLCSLEYQQSRIVQICEEVGAKFVQVSNTEEEANRIWTARRSAFGACAKLKPNVESGDIIVPREKIPQLVDEIRKICDKNNLMVCILGHIGDGNIHPHIPIDLENVDEVRRYELAKDQVHRLAVDLGGTLSAEHGIGCEKAKYMQFGIDGVVLEYMKKIKKIFDPKNILNPGKIFF